MDKNRICSVCNTLYTPNQRFAKIQKYCSFECCTKANMRRYYERKKANKIHVDRPVFTKECVICGTSFQSVAENAKYCSHKCRRRNENRRSDKFKVRSSAPKEPCHACGFTDLRAIHRHHINPSEGNGGGVMCLCANCHYIFHSEYGWGNGSEKLSKEGVLEVLKHANDKSLADVLR